MLLEVGGPEIRPDWSDAVTGGLSGGMSRQARRTCHLPRLLTWGMPPIPIAQNFLKMKPHMSNKQAAKVGDFFL